MVRINNGEVSKEIREVADIQNAAEPIPTELSNQVVAVIDINPKHSRYMNGYYSISQAATGTSTLGTTPTTKDFFITGASLQLRTDATADNTSAALTCYAENGANINLIFLRKNTTTATQENQFVQFAIPIKTKRGTIIEQGTSFAAGGCSLSSQVYGFFVEQH